MPPEAWLAAGREQLLWLAEHRHPALDGIFLVFTGLGTEAFLLLFVAVGYWLVDRRLFGRAALMLLVAGTLNTWLKGLFLVPRPDVLPVHSTGGWSFPSGHAQVAGALWGGLAWDLRRRVPAGAALLVVLALFVSASRPYLGVHYPHDVLVGLTLGALQVVVLAGIDRAGLDIRGGARTRWSIAGLGAAGFALVALTFHPTVEALGVRLFGAGVGLLLGVLEARARGWGTVPGSWRARLRLLGVGLVGLVLAWIGLKLFAEQIGLGGRLAVDFLRYLLIGGWVAAGAPAMDAWLLRRRAAAPGGDGRAG